MQSILEQITDWLKSMIISGIMGNLSGMFDSVNQQVGQIAGDVGTTPANFSPAVFSMIRNISESVILPIAGMVLTFIACYELIQMLIEHQAAGDRQILADQLNISPHQLSYVTHSGEGEGLLFYGNVILPFVDRFPTDLELYRIMTTKLTEVQEAKEA